MIKFKYTNTKRTNVLVQDAEGKTIGNYTSTGGNNWQFKIKPGKELAEDGADLLDSKFTDWLARQADAVTDAPPTDKMPEGEEIIPEPTGILRPKPHETLGTTSKEFLDFAATDSMPKEEFLSLYADRWQRPPSSNTPKKPPPLSPNAPKPSSPNLPSH